MARAIVDDAFRRVGAAIARQQHRLRYRSIRGRYRLVSDHSALLQRCLLASWLERHASRTDRVDLLTHVLVFLVWSCLERNVFYLTVGLCRLVYGYSTAETIAVYDLLARDPDRLRSADTFRRCKQRLVEALLNRFPRALAVRRGPRGEARLGLADPSADDANTGRVGATLELLCPWGTECPIVDEHFDARFDPLPLPSNPRDSADSQRCHCLLHPTCLLRLTRALGLAPPQECLT
ncbi:MAG: hypothetical protein AAGC60_01490 [Acidobacteriota bacterium]